MSSGTISSGLLLILLGVWVVMQTLAGDLAGRLISYGNAGTPAGPQISAPPSKSSTGDQGGTISPNPSAPKSPAQPGHTPTILGFT